MGKLRCSKTLMNSCPTIPVAADYGDIPSLFILFSILVIEAPAVFPGPMGQPLSSTAFLDCHDDSGHIALSIDRVMSK